MAVGTTKTQQASKINQEVHSGDKMMYITGSTVVLTCCKGDCQSQWKTPIFGPPELGNPLTDFDKI